MCAELFLSLYLSVPFLICMLHSIVNFNLGFTSLCESYCQKGVTGIEELAYVLNGFMSTLSASKYMHLLRHGNYYGFYMYNFLMNLHHLSFRNSHIN